MSLMSAVAPGWRPGCCGRAWASLWLSVCRLFCLCPRISSALFVPSGQIEHSTTRLIMGKVVIIGSGASGVHFALSLLGKGYEVIMLDVGRAKPPAVNPED